MHRIDLAAIPGVHKGTSAGTTPWQTTKLVVDPATVPGTGTLAFHSAPLSTITMLYAIDDPQVVPNWFGVAVPPNAASFANVNLFFHPLPAQAGYDDRDYPTKSSAHGSNWKVLFHYMERLGYQIAGAGRDQIVIMPFLPQAAASNTGILPARWRSLFTSILTDVRARMGKDNGQPLQIQELVVSSFSVGILYSYVFRHDAAGLQPLLKEVWDFDGYSSTSSVLSVQLHTTSQYRAIKYDRAAEQGSFHVPSPRWTAYPDPPPNPPAPGRAPTPDQDYPKALVTQDLHHAIRDYMFLHAATSPPPAP